MPSPDRVAAYFEQMSAVGVNGQDRHGEPFPEAITPAALAKLLRDLPSGASD